MAFPGLSCFFLFPSSPGAATRSGEESRIGERAKGPSLGHARRQVMKREHREVPHDERSSGCYNLLFHSWSIHPSIPRRPEVPDQPGHPSIHPLPGVVNMGRRSIREKRRRPSKLPDLFVLYLICPVSKLARQARGISASRTLGFVGLGHAALSWTGAAN